MKPEKPSSDCCSTSQHFHKHHSSGASNTIYALGVIGALFYFLQHATTFSLVMIGIGKSIFWPAILMFKLLTFLQM
ncbi:MAG: hypothetical protein WAV41_00620 [Microgenomates group bacterium]